MAFNLYSLPDSSKFHQLTKLFFYACVCVFVSASNTEAQKLKALGPVTVITAKDPTVSITIFDTEDGLALSSVYAGFKDRRGNLWFGTLGGGVSKYDGRGFQNFTATSGLTNNVVVNIVEDRRGDLWFGTYGGGVSRYDGISFNTFTDKDGLANNIVLSSLEASNGNLWFGTFDGGVSVYDGKTFKTFTTAEGLINNKVWTIAEDKNGSIYFGTDNGVSKFDGKKFTSVASVEGKGVNSILIDSQEALWIGTFSDGVYKLSGGNVQQFTKLDGLSDNVIWKIIQDSKGLIWIGTESGGVNSFDGENFATITVDEGLSHNGVRSITEDNNGSLWFGTFGGGINRYSGKIVTTYNAKQGLPFASIKDIIEDHKGNLWLGSFGGGLIKFDGLKYSIYNTVSGLPSNLVRAVLEDRSHSIWIGTHGAGLTRFDGSRLITYTSSNGLPDNNISSLLEDRDGRVWVGTEGGLAVFDGKQFKSFTTTDGLAQHLIWDILQDRKGDYWFATHGGGVSVYDGKKFKTYTVADGLCDNLVFSLFEDSAGNIWIGGADNGLSRFDGKTFLNFTKSEGLPDQSIYDISETTDRKLWIGTNLGITELSFVNEKGDVINGGELTETNIELKKNFTLKWDAYNNKTGYKIKDIAMNTMFVRRAGPSDGKQAGDLIWTGTGDDKLLRFDPKASGLKGNAPDVVLNAIKINDEEICWKCLKPAMYDSAATAQELLRVYGTVLSQEQLDTLSQKFRALRFKAVEEFSHVPSELSLPHEMNRITFDYNAIETSRYFLVNYRYMLEGEDEKWSPPTKGVQATYSNLWEGSYVFKVMAQGANGVWGQPALYSFVVMPPWWREPWMYALYAVAFISSAIAFVKIRERGLKKDKISLESLVNERTSELMTQIETAKEQKKEVDAQKTEADRQRTLVEEKNAEIAKQLADTEASLSNLTLQMIQRFHSYSELEQELKKLADVNDAKKYQRAFSLITMNKSLDKEWEQFNFYFNGIYKGFNTKLMEQSQQLSNYDLRMCALIKMGLENREIAMLLNIEVSSVKMAKYRLKKKFNIDESVSLKSYFETF